MGPQPGPAEQPVDAAVVIRAADRCVSRFMMTHATASAVSGPARALPSRSAAGGADHSQDVADVVLRHARTARTAAADLDAAVGRLLKTVTEARAWPPRRR